MFSTRRRRAKRIRQRGWFFGLRKLGHSKKRKLKVIIFSLIFIPYYLWIRLFRLMWWSWPGKKTVNVIAFTLWHVNFLIRFCMNSVVYIRTMYYRWITVNLYIYATIQGDRIDIEDIGMKDACRVSQYIFGFIILWRFLKERIKFRVHDFPWRMIDRYIVLLKWNKEFRVLRNCRRFIKNVKYLRYLPEDILLEGYKYKYTICGLFVLKSIFYGYVFYWFFCWYLALTVLECLN